MTKKDYEKAVEVVREIAYSRGNYEAEIAVCAFTKLFLGDNPRFDSSRFDNACREIIVGNTVAARAVRIKEENDKQKAFDRRNGGGD